MTSSLVGSEMCIRDSAKDERQFVWVGVATGLSVGQTRLARSQTVPLKRCCLLYTSDAADDM
eukprot:10763354-Prorocentrum_lima.AAC.1